MARWKLWVMAGSALALADAALATTLAVGSGPREVAVEEDLSWQETPPLGAVSVPLGEVGSGGGGGDFPAVAPEPTTLVLVSLGLAGLTVAGRRRSDDPS